MGPITRLLCSADTNSTALLFGGSKDQSATQFLRSLGINPGLDTGFSPAFDTVGVAAGLLTTSATSEVSVVSPILPLASQQQSPTSESLAVVDSPRSQVVPLSVSLTFFLMVNSPSAPLHDPTSALFPILPVAVLVGF